MFEVELHKITFHQIKRWNKTKEIRRIEVVDAYYFDELTDAKQFARFFNQKMPFYEDGYVTAWKPVEYKTFTLQDILTDAFMEVKEYLQNTYLPQNNKYD